MPAIVAERSLARYVLLAWGASTLSVFDTLFTDKNVRKIWRRLRESEVPIVTDDDYKNVPALNQTLLRDINQTQYVPSIGHGYLGYSKSSGCTRFVPILTKEDMAVYYILTLSLQDFLVKDIDGVYGGWHMVPEKAKKNNSPDSQSIISDPYFSNSFSKKEWFKNWSSFNDMISDLTETNKAGNFVATTDIANFYDTIDVGRLCNKISLVVKGHDEIIELLRFFLNFWDRRIKGYYPSTRGIPQEIITDASRMLANFYLADFDLQFKDYCEKNDLTYTRWADDIVIFGKSRPQLESAIHKASRFLLPSGLNLNASKSRIFTRSDYRMYRALDVLSAVRAKDAVGFAKAIRRFEGYSRNNEARVDTAYRASLGFAAATPKARTPHVLSYLLDLSDKYEYLGHLTPSLFRKKYELFGSKYSTLRRDTQLICRKPYAAAKASYLLFIRKSAKDLFAKGVSKKQLRGLVEQITKSAADSTLITEICAPAARKRLD